uniref:Cystathionine beta-synthase n=1 Tax=Photinus pyralis TaxID=7054 RepID=A0A1Y1KD97_PHOPY
MEVIRPDQPSKCLYHKDKNAPNPHGECNVKTIQKINPNILHLIGNTPLVKLNRIPQSLGIKCEILAKCEFQNPGGSVKDRIALSMIEDAEKRGLLKPGCTVIEPTSGNTGIALAMGCAVKGYNCICVVPDYTSPEKQDRLKSLGAKVVVTPCLPVEHPDGPFLVAERLSQTIPNSIILRQFNNPHNPMAHYNGTAMEILDQCGGQVDMVTVGVGSGGSAAGIGRRLKELLPNCLMVGVDPSGSTIAEPPSLNETGVTGIQVEGMGHDFNPTILDRKVIDFWVKVDDKSAFEMARRLHREEGILCGGSAGCLMSGALQAAKQLKEGQRCVVILPDGVGNYLTKFVSDYWMESMGFMHPVNTLNHWWWNYKVSDLKLSLEPMTISPTLKCMEVSRLLKKEKLDVLPCVDDKNVFHGLLHATNLVNQMLRNIIHPNDTVEKVLSQKYRKVTLESNLGELSHILERELVAVVVEEIEVTPPKFKLLLHSGDLLEFITDSKRDHL